MTKFMTEFHDFFMTVSNSRIFHDRGNPAAKSIVTMYVAAFDKDSPMAGADPGFFAGGGGGVNDGRVQRAPLAPAPTGGLGLINIRLRYIASIEYSEQFFLFFFFAIVKKFVDKKNWWSRAGGGGHDPPPPWIRA